nr:PREDICTED: low molecular weight phosphotyrosine protein phosphatase-like [Bemisia tabaci]XP_018902606.1 PREDICTED: low molecular weight phosphotyrosine protein phosphatase-like [Bemisia tabaci]XP_018902617.1 PREDICTED: low molecular weight phosphotyrosine protein phosphatase-like [Bemisia tabaci]XP_018902623.1 PREDICTED: low molecular weight phosphotyrosine protein phosphatase-like [Bemisia tabaci]
MAAEPSLGPKSVMFVCLGNICRSPIADCVMRHLVKERNLSGWTVDSSGTGSWHVGSPADRRAQQILEAHGVDSTHTAKQIKKKNFSEFSYIFGMDEQNISDLKRSAPANSPAKIELLGDYDPQGEKIIRDPYYDSDTAGFEKVYEQCLRCCTAFLEKVESKK